MSLNVLNHLGLNLYSNVPAVLSEAVANAYDADAEIVNITIEDNKITIEDDGTGMDLEEINQKYLLVGYRKREDGGESITPTFKRPVMGRKGIGKLSLFSIANNIELFTVKNGVKNGLKMNRVDIEAQIKKSDVYHPIDIPANAFDVKKGTRIIVSDLKKSIQTAEAFLRRRLARRFSVIGRQNSNFTVKINGEEIGVEDRDYLKAIEFLWLIGDEEDQYSAKYKNIQHVDRLPGEVRTDDGKTYKINGWIGSVKRPSQLNDGKMNNNKISILVREKMAQEDILDTFNEGGIFADYLIGEIAADFLDEDSEEDISTSSRQKINEEDPRYQKLVELAYAHIKKIQSGWTKLRNDRATDDTLKENPAVKEWHDTLKTTREKEQAAKLFSTIETLYFDKEDESKKKELYKHGILAFERLRLMDNLEKIHDLNTAKEIEIAAIFSDLNSIESILYYDIASERVAVIRKLAEITDENQKEKVIQEHIFDNLWLLNPAWERATKGSERMEEKIETEWKKVVATLTDDERKGRFDIKYRTYCGTHIIVELKRYKTSYKLTTEMLAAQVDKYTKALQKVLEANGRGGEPIQAICIVGKPLDETQHRTNEKLAAYNARVFYYDQMIEEALQSYDSYLIREKEVKKLKDILDKIEGKIPYDPGQGLANKEDKE